MIRILRSDLPEVSSASQGADAHEDNLDRNRCNHVHLTGELGWSGRYNAS